MRTLEKRLRALEGLVPDDSFEDWTTEELEAELMASFDQQATQYESAADFREAFYAWLDNLPAHRCEKPGCMCAHHGDPHRRIRQLGEDVIERRWPGEGLQIPRDPMNPRLLASLPRSMRDGSWQRKQTAVLK
jgi:hypothetical protein